MASKLSFVQYIADQIHVAGQIRFRKMFGEYAVYCNDKVIALVCDNQLFIKPTQGGKKFLENVIEAQPYPGARPHFLIDELDNSDWLVELAKITFNELPDPEPKKKSIKTSKVKSGSEKKADKIKPLLNNEHEFPDDAVLARNLGNAKKLWDNFLCILASEFESLSLTWKYYHDGKAWLCKLAHKKKTVCWISVWSGFFKVSFYFTQKNDPDIKTLEIDVSLRESYFSQVSSGKLKPLVIEVKTKESLRNLAPLIKYKAGST